MLVVSLFCPVPTGSFGARSSGDVPVQYRTTSGNDVGLRVWNIGTFGTNLANRSPSLEYPLGTGMEHLVRAGIWVGALSPTGDRLVSTGAIDGMVGSFDPSAISEFTQADVITERSTLPNSRYYDPQAESEQDFCTAFTDTIVGNRPYHRPLGIKVIETTTLFSIHPLDGVIFASYKIVNTNPDEPLRDVYLGMYAELASGWKNGHMEWPPTGWFRCKDIAFVDSLHLATEHHYTLDNGNCPSWGGFMLLATRPVPVDSLTISFNWWDWSLGPATDSLRYEMMRNGEVDRTGGVEAPDGDPVTLLSLGPFHTLAADDTLSVVFAWLGGEPSVDPPRSAEQDIVYRAVAARLYNDHPTPIWIESLDASVIDDVVVLRWFVPADVIHPAFDVYRDDGDGWRRINEQAITGSDAGFEYRDPDVIPGAHYEYAIAPSGDRESAGRYGPIPIDVPAVESVAMHVEPNPVTSRATVVFTLMRPAEVRFSVHDVAGREVRGIDLGRLGAGVHKHVWDGRDNAGRKVPSGIYHCVAVYGGSGRVARPVVVLR